MKLIHIFAAALFVLFGASSAYAGSDLTDYQPLPAAARSCGGPYSGFYAGGIIGFGGMNSKISQENNGSIKDHDRGFTIGGTTGYNWQCNGTLLGVETDISYFNADNKWNFGCCGVSEGFDSEINWFGTLRGRVGLVTFENLLVFGTGGLAYGGIDHSFNFRNEPIGSFSQSDSDTEVGWTVGGGIEYLLSDNWAFRADALYVDFGSQDHTYTTDACGESCTARLSWEDNFWVARVGLTYLFGAKPEPVAYDPPAYEAIK